MSPQYSLFFTLAAVAVAMGIAAAQVVSRLLGGPRRLVAHLIPVVTAFGAMGALGHSLGAHFGPKVELYGFEVSLLGDMLIGFVGGLAGALLQLATLRALRGRSTAA